MTEAEQAQARRDSEIYSVEDAPTESGGTDCSVIAELREEMRQDDIDSRMDGWEKDYNRIERPY
jgi:hypothetical protein